MNVSVAEIDQQHATELTQALHEADMLAAVYLRLRGHKIPGPFAQELTLQWWNKPDQHDEWEAYADG